MTNAENQRPGGDPHHPDHPRNRNSKAPGYRRLVKDKAGQAKASRRKRVMNDPHHPNHPRNQAKDVEVTEQAEVKGGTASANIVTDPHHPDHPRNN